MQQSAQTNTTLPVSDTSSSSQSITVPVLGEGFTAITSSEKDPKSKKRFWQLGKKKDTKDITTSSISPPPRSVSPFAGGLRSNSPQPAAAMVSPSSPGRQMSSSSRLNSPAESQIFERNVQEDSAAVATSPAIPSHIATEDHIPAVLDASSMAITDNQLTPDNVEIVTHAAHLPAAAAMSGSNHPDSTLTSPTSEEAPQTLESSFEEPIPSYAALDSADIRRLSFISFADVVHGEHTDGTHLSGVASSITSPVGARSPSPIRSPVSPSLSATGDMSKSMSLESSPGRRAGPGSPKSIATSLATSQSPAITGEIAIETMSQALRKTRSGDLDAATRSSVSAL